MREGIFKLNCSELGVSSQHKYSWNVHKWLCSFQWCNFPLCKLKFHLKKSYYLKRYKLVLLFLQKRVVVQMRVTLFPLDTFGQALPLHCKLIHFKNLASFMLTVRSHFSCVQWDSPSELKFQNLLSETLSVCVGGIKPEEREIATGYADTSLLHSRKKANTRLARHSLVPVIV